VFVLCMARSVLMLLRFLLDAHPGLTSSPLAGSDGYPARGTFTGRSLAGALRRFSLLPVPVPGEAGGGGVMLAVLQRPT